MGAKDRGRVAYAPFVGSYNFCLVCKHLCQAVYEPDFHKLMIQEDYAVIFVAFVSFLCLITVYLVLVL